MPTMKSLRAEVAQMEMRRKLNEAGTEPLYTDTVLEEKIASLYRQIDGKQSVNSATMVAIYHETFQRPLFGKGGPVVCSMKELRTVYKMRATQLAGMKKSLAKFPTYMHYDILRGFFFIQLCP